jgi:hypothetical protein
VLVYSGALVAKLALQQLAPCIVLMTLMSALSDVMVADSRHSACCSLGHVAPEYHLFVSSFNHCPASS